MIALGLQAPARRPETRDYTSQIVASAEAAAAGAGDGVATATAAVEAAAGEWARALSTATVTPRSGRTAALTPPVLAMIGRALCRSGQIVFDLDVSGGRVRLLPASAAYVTVGNGDPRTWIYTVTVDGPGNTRTVYRTRDGVAHLQYAVDPVRPWIGRAPWAAAPLSSTMLAGIERQLAGEAGASSGYVMPAPDVGDHGAALPPDGPDDGETDPTTTLRRDLAAARGSIVLAPTMRGGHGAGAMAAPEGDFKSHRFGMHPPSALLEARRDVERSIYAASGIRPAMMNPAAAGTAMREAHRQFVAGTIEPIAGIVAAQLSEALGVAVSLDMPRPAEVATLARAVHSLTQSGVPLADARRAVGL